MMLPEPALSGETSDVEADAECCDNDCDPSFHQGLAWTDGLSGHNSWHPHTEKFSVREYLLISPFQIIVNVQSLVIDHVYWSASHTVVTSDDGGGVTVLSVNVMQSVMQAVHNRRDTVTAWAPSVASNVQTSRREPRGRGEVCIFKYSKLVSYLALCLFNCIGLYYLKFSI